MREVRRERSQRSPSISRLDTPKRRRSSVHKTLADLETGAMSVKEQVAERTRQQELLSQKALQTQYAQAIEMDNMRRAADNRPLLIPPVGLIPKTAPATTTKSFAPVAAKPGVTNININPPQTVPTAAPAAPVTAAPTAAKQPAVTTVVSIAGASFKSVDGGKYEVVKPGPFDQQQVDHLAGIVSTIDTKKSQIITNFANNVPAYITVEDKITKQFQGAYPITPGQTLIPQPTSNDAVEMQQWVDQNEAAKTGVARLDLSVPFSAHLSAPLEARSHR